MNYVFLMGNLTDTPKFKITRNGKSFTRFFLAVDRSYLNKRKERETDFIPIVTWGRLAEICSTYLQKGTKVNVIGEIKIERYKDKEGLYNFFTEVVAKDVIFLEKVRKRNIEDLAKDIREPF